MPTRSKIFSLGFLGCLVVFAVYYLRHATTVVEHYSRHGPLGAGVALLSLVVVACVGGVFALMHAPLTRKAAFSVGLGLAGLLLAADLSLAGKTADGAPTTLASLPEGTARTVVESIQLVVGPVRAVRG